MPWHTFMESMDRVALHQLMSIPDRDESYANTISDHTKEYFDIYMNKISKQSYLIQRKILSINGGRAEDLLTAGFRSRESETATKHYSHLMSLVAIGLFRKYMGQSGDTTSLAAPLTTALDRLRLSIDQQSEVAIQRQYPNRAEGRLQHSCGLAALSAHPPFLGKGLLTCEEISVKIESDDETVVYDFADPTGSRSTSSPEALLGEGLLTCEEIAVKVETDDDAVVYDFADPAGSPSTAGSPSQAVTSPSRAAVLA